MSTEHEHDQSLEEILYGDFYPKKPVVCEIEGLQIPFAPLCGEYIEYLGSLPNGVIALSNYRFFANGKDLCTVNLPIGTIETVEVSSGNTFSITCKTGQYYKCLFENGNSVEWHKRLMEAIKGQTCLSNCFALAFCAWSRTEGMCSEELLKEILPRYESVFEQEVERMGFCLDPEVKAWRISDANINYGICSTYPQKHVVPFNITDEMLIDMAKHRSHQRFPTIVWRDQKTGLVMARSSQPLQGWLSWRNISDETFISSIGVSCLLNPGPNSPAGVDEASRPDRDLLLIDARSYSTAVLNRVKGGGTECQEYYTSSVVNFMNLHNIHEVRRSFNHMRQACGIYYNDDTWLNNLESSKWLSHVSNLLKSAIIVVDGIVVDRMSVLVHCSDGWDRTPSILSLAQIFLDPHYRTIKGFRDLVEREWLNFGHKFADRCGQGNCSGSVHERCPVFLLWLDCVHQVVHQMPCYFEFNMTFLVKLAWHTYSCLFGDFLYNSDQERRRQSDHKTISIWGFLFNDRRLVNPLYKHTDMVIRPHCFSREMQFWSQVYARRSQAVLASTYLEELHKREHVPEESADDTQEVFRDEEDADGDDGIVVQTEVKKRSRSLGRQLSRDDIGTTSNALQSLSLENFETNKLSKQCLEGIENVALDDTTSTISLGGQLAIKYMSPKISRTRQEEAKQPRMARDEASRQISGQMDADGLTLDTDIYSDAINKTFAVYTSRIEELQRQVEEMKKFRPVDVVKNDPDPKDEVLSQGSHSESSWEMVNDQVKLVLWMPDHAVTSCFRCEKKFWAGLRRHHCRLCGRIFCFECTKKSIPCPDQLLNTPVRVCEGCYEGAVTS